MTESRDAAPARRARPAAGTGLRAGAVGVFGILFFVLSAQAPLTGIVGAAPLTIALGTGAGAPASYLLVAVVLLIFAVGFISMSRRITGQGAFYVYVRASLGKYAGAAAAWMAMLAYWSIQGTMYGLYGFSVAGLFLGIGIDVPWWVYSIVTLVLVQVLGSLGIELGARVLAVLVILETLILIVFAVVVVATGDTPQGFDIAATFSPMAVVGGALGVSVMFAFASMFGFESTAIYSSEAKDPVRTVPRATYLSIIVIGLFFTLVVWTFVSYYGADAAAPAAMDAVASGNGGAFILTPVAEVLGGPVSFVTSLLLVSSLFAGILAFHNAINRYLHSLGLRGSLPLWVSATNRFRAPARAALVQSIGAVVIMLPFIVLGLNPVSTLFAWFGGVAVAALLVLYVLSSVAFFVFFLRHRERENVWQAFIAPALAAVLLTALLATVVVNFSTLVGGDLATSLWLLAIVPVVLVVGILVETRNGTVLTDGSGSAASEQDARAGVGASGA